MYATTAVIPPRIETIIPIKRPNSALEVFINSPLQYSFKAMLWQFHTFDDLMIKTLCLLE